MKRIIIITSIIYFQVSISHAQDNLWNVGMHTFFDNREYFNDYVQPQSIVGALAYAHGGYSFDENKAILFGGNFLYEYGDNLRKEYFNPTLFIRSQGENFDVYMGAFPRKSLIELPKVLLSDTFAYYRPNVEGMYFKYKHQGLSQSLWLDWTSRQTNTTRETFLIGGTGKGTANILFFKYNFLMYHYAGTAIKDTNDHIRDNGGINATLGINLANMISLDSLSLQTGISLSYDRLRSVYDLDYRTGSYTELYVEYKNLGIRNTLYFGNGQTLMVGDGLFSSKMYNRTDLFWNIFSSDNIKGILEFSFHALPEVMDVSQRFCLYVALNNR